MTVSASYLCAVCGEVASTVTLVATGQPDPRLTPEPPGVPPGVSMILADHASLSIAGGPVSVTVGPVPVEAVAAALATGRASALFEIDSELAPFWCPRCRAAYCRDHYRTETLYDDGFFDCIRGTCPKGHQRTLED